MNREGALVGRRKVSIVLKLLRDDDLETVSRRHGVTAAARNTSKSVRAIYVPVDFMRHRGEGADHATVFRTYSGGLDGQRW